MSRRGACTKKVCPTNIRNAEQKKNLFYVTKNGSLGKAPLKNVGRGRKRIIQKKAIKVKRGELYYLKKSSTGKLKIHRAKLKNVRR